MRVRHMYKIFTNDAEFRIKLYHVPCLLFSLLGMKPKWKWYKYYSYDSYDYGEYNSLKAATKQVEKMDKWDTVDDLRDQGWREVSRYEKNETGGTDVQG